MRYLTALIISAFLLAACNISEMSAKIMPDNIQAMAERDIDAVFAEDTSAFAGLQGDKTDAEFQKVLENVFKQRRGGDEISRNIATASVNSSISVGEGKTARYEAIYEIATTEGYTAVELVYVQTPDDAECCRLSYINVSGHDTSPYLDALLMVEQITKYIGIAILLITAAILLLIFWLVRRSRKRREAGRV